MQLMSAQFVELKGCLFKKFGPENLFQIAVSGLGYYAFLVGHRHHFLATDIVERFTLIVYTFLIVFTTLKDASQWGAPISLADNVFVFSLFFAASEVGMLVRTHVRFMDFCRQCFVDWIKHLSAVKYNSLEPDVYRRFCDILSRDLLLVNGKVGFMCFLFAAKRRL